jgi:uncharacterized protein involved in type VI secretion and phage assembly
MSLERIVADLLERVQHRYYGKYRGTVIDNRDPAKLGRLRLNVPSVLGGEVVTGWATPCTPYGGASGQGFVFIPEVGAGVWTEFEEGDLEFPVWVGTFWSQPNAESELPKPNQAGDGAEEDSVQDPPTSKIIKTTKGHTLQFEDADGSEMVLVREGSKGHFLTMDQNGITIIDADSNTIKFTSNGIAIEDKNGNKLEMTAGGIKASDVTGNAIEMSGSALTILAKVPFKIDASGQTVTVVGSSIDLQRG